MKNVNLQVYFFLAFFEEKGLAVSKMVRNSRPSLLGLDCLIKFNQRTYAYLESIPRKETGIARRQQPSLFFREMTAVQLASFGVVLQSVCLVPLAMIWDIFHFSVNFKTSTASFVILPFYGAGCVAWYVSKFGLATVAEIPVGLGITGFNIYGYVSSALEKVQLSLYSCIYAMLD